MPRWGNLHQYSKKTGVECMLNMWNMFNYLKPCVKNCAETQHKQKNTHGKKNMWNKELAKGMKEGKKYFIQTS